MENRILVIDDNPDISEIVRLALEDIGFNVLTSRKCPHPKTIELLAPAAIILDIDLGSSVPNGLDFCRELKSRNSARQIPVLLLSGKSDLAKLAAINSAEDYLHKPLNIEDLLKKISRFVPEVA